ncbi:putative mitochondrial protein, partial [Mucuna pruriens]
MQSPCSSNLNTTTHVIHYLKGSIGKCLFLSASSHINLVKYADPDWVSCPTTRSTTNYFTMLGSSLVSWKTKKQPKVHCSSIEVEYHSLTALTPELHLLNECTKPFKIDCHFVHENVKASLVAPSYLRSRDQLANSFTKLLGGVLDISIPTPT